MESLRGRVTNGRLVLDEPIDLPDGAEVELAIIDVPDELADAERELLHRAIDAGLDEIDAGLSVDAADALARLRRG